MKYFLVIGFIIEVCLFLTTGFFIDRNIPFSIGLLFISIYWAAIVGMAINDSAKDEVYDELSND